MTTTAFHWLEIVFLSTFQLLLFSPVFVVHVHWKLVLQYTEVHFEPGLIPWKLVYTEVQLEPGLIPWKLVYTEVQLEPWPNSLKVGVYS